MDFNREEHKTKCVSLVKKGRELAQTEKLLIGNEVRDCISGLCDEIEALLPEIRTLWKGDSE